MQRKVKGSEADCCYMYMSSCSSCFVPPLLSSHVCSLWRQGPCSYCVLQTAPSRSLPLLVHFSSLPLFFFIWYTLFTIQAVERVRITVQLRRLANSSKQESAATSPFSNHASQNSPAPQKPVGKSPKKPGRASSMSLESMRSVMSNLRGKGKSSAAEAGRS